MLSISIGAQSQVEIDTTITSGEHFLDSLVKSGSIIGSGGHRFLPVEEQPSISILTDKNYDMPYLDGRSILVLMYAYKDWCYSDSVSLGYYYQICDWGCVEVECEQNGFVIREPENCYEKKVPQEHPTFLGFLNWIEERCTNCKL